MDNEYFKPYSQESPNLKTIDELADMLRRSMEYDLGLRRLHPLWEDTIQQSSTPYFKQKQKITEGKIDSYFGLYQEVE